MASLQPNGSHESASPNGSAAPQNKLLERVVRTPGREPSPQPTHLSVPGAIHKRTLHDAGSGYIATKFEGRQQQMDDVEDLLSEKGYGLRCG